MRTAPRIFLLLENPSKSNNLGPILRCASTFGIQTVVAVGYSKCAAEGSHGASKHVRVFAWPTVEQAARFVREECQCSQILGLLGALPDGYDETGCCVREEDGLAKAAGKPAKDVLGRSLPVNSFPFRQEGNLCVAISKHAQGLSLTLACICDAFCHVPVQALYKGQHSPPLLDTPACLSILLHEFTEQAGYNERNFHGQKFEVARAVQPSSNAAAKKHCQREEERKMRAAEEVTEAGTLPNIFGSDSGDY